MFLMLLSGTYQSESQKFFTSFFGGISTYQGDLVERPLALEQSKFAWGVGLLVELNDRMFIRGDFTSGKLSGDDRLGVKNRQRNLNFFSNIYEFSLGFEYVLFNLYDYKVSPYVFTGISRYSFSPKTLSDDGNEVSLFELNTEGQGFYKNRKPYKLRQFAIPFGGGLQWAITDNKRIGFVIGIRKTFTDYIDDVSTTYVDKDILFANRRNAPAFAYRGDELPNGDPYPPDGTKRGNPTSKDWYYFSGITLRVRIQPGKQKQHYSQKFKRAKVTCPKPM